MAFKHGVSEGTITGFPRSNRFFEGFFQKHLDKWLRPLGISEGALSGINFDANAEISVQKAASILMPQTKNGAVSEPRAGQT